MILFPGQLTIEGCIRVGCILHTETGHANTRLLSPSETHIDTVSCQTGYRCTVYFCNSTWKITQQLILSVFVPLISRVKSNKFPANSLPKSKVWSGIGEGGGLVKNSFLENTLSMYNLNTVFISSVTVIFTNSNTLF